jgi:predicted flap endonuclease-1-like 5' DNA nuclease
MVAIHVAPVVMALQEQGLSPLAWLAIIVAIVLLVWLFIWLLRHDWGLKHAETKPRATMAVEKPAVEAPVVETPEAMPAVEGLPPIRLKSDVSELAVDDLEIIEGIGPKICAVLNEAGITTFAQLAAMTPEQIHELLHAQNLRLADPTTWPEQARLAAAGDEAGLKALQDKLKGGRAV